MTTGVTPAGFVPKLATDLIADVTAQMQGTIDPTLDLSPDEPLGQITGILCSKMAEIWELGATAYNGFDQQAVEGVQQDSLYSLTGTLRNASRPSFVTCTCNLNAGVTLPAGSIAAVLNQPTIQFVVSADTTNSGGSPANVPVLFQSSADGPVVANAGTLTVIVTPVSGWNSVTNPLDAAIGAVQESDADFMVRQQEELSAAGGSSVPALRADLLLIPGVQQAFVFENTGPWVDANGVPPHSIECTIYDGLSSNAANSAVFAAVWNGKPAGTDTYGNTAGFVADATGKSQPVHFSRAVQVPIYQTYILTTDATFPLDGIAQVKAAVALKAQQYFNLGVPVIDLVFRAAALSVQGVIDVPTYYQGLAPTPSGTANITIGTRSIAVADTSRMLVNGV